MNSISEIKQRSLTTIQNAIVAIGLAATFFNVLLRILTFISGSESFELDLPLAPPFNPLILLVISLGLRRVKPKNIFLRKIMLFLMTELILFVIKKFEMKRYQHRELFVMWATLLIVNFQLPMINSYFVLLLVNLKHYFEWIFIDYYLEIAESSIETLPLGILFVGYLYNVMILRERMKIEEELIRAHERLTDKNEKMKTIIEASLDGLAVVNTELKVLKNNRNVIQMLGVDRRQLAQAISKLKYVKNSNGDPYRNPHLSLDAKEFFHRELDAQRTLGCVGVNEKYIEIQAKRVLWDRHEAILLTFRDVTQRFEHEVSEIEHRCQIQLLKFISHELKTPTISIIAYTEDLEKIKETHVSPEKRVNISIINASAKLLLFFIGDIIDYTKILTGDFSLKKSSVGLENVIKEVTSLLTHQIRRKNLDLRIRLDPYLPKEINTDPARVSQILVILLTNALKFTSSGSIEVVAVQSEPSKIKVLISDTGCGISPHRLAYIKEGFSSSIRRGITKIGLDFSNFLSQALGGRPIKMKSALNEGTTIKFYIDLGLPLSRNYKRSESSYYTAEDTHRISIPLLSQSSGWVKILIVDDYEFNRMALSMILHSNSISHYEAGNGEEAVKLIEKYDSAGVPIEVVFMDIDMPIMDGLKASKKVHKMFREGKISAIPNIIGYSALSGSEDIKNCYEAGMVHYLAKPSPALEILQTLKAYSIS